MTAYYNENDKYCADWLRNLIDAGHIARGDVDERSIVDVKPDDLRGYTQCHFFAGIGGWSRALRLAGWDDDRPVWTGSCPCQPFSAAGAGKAADDERHLWPAWFPLIAECRPATVFGEQVEAAIGWGWLDAVFADLEAEGYACGATVLPACGVGAPHIRQRLWFVADTLQPTSEWRAGGVPGAQASLDRTRELDVAHGLADGGQTGELAYTMRGRAGPGPAGRDCQEGAAFEIDRGLPRASVGPRIRSPFGKLAISAVAGSQRSPERSTDSQYDDNRQASERAKGQHGARVAVPHWAAADWLPCTDGKARPVEPGPQQMADGLSEMLGRLRPDSFSQIEKAIADGEISEADSREALRDLWCVLAAQSLQRATGRFRSVREAPVLLAFLRELAREGWQLLDHLPSACWQTPEAGLRELRRSASKTACPPQGRRPSQQRNKQSTDAMSVLSQALAHEAERAGMIPFPLATGIPGRVGRLRAYGNAIVPQVAAEFIAAADEAIMSTQAPRQHGEGVSR